MFLLTRPPTARYPAASADCLDLLRQMLAFFPEDRITALDALAHPFFTPIRREDREVGAEACQHCMSRLSQPLLVCLLHVLLCASVCLRPTPFVDCTHSALVVRAHDTVQHPGPHLGGGSAVQRPTSHRHAPWPCTARALATGTALRQTVPCACRSCTPTDERWDKLPPFPALHCTEPASMEQPNSKLTRTFT